MDDKTVEQIADFSEGLDGAAKQRILEKARQKMNRDKETEQHTDSRTEVVNMKTNDNRTEREEKAEVRRERPEYLRAVLSAAACFALIAGSAVILASLKNSSSTVHLSPDSGTGSCTASECPESPEITGITENTASEPDEEYSVYADYAEKPVTSVVTVKVPGISEFTSETENSGASENTDVRETEDGNENYENEYLAVFREKADELDELMLLIHGFGVQTSYDEMVWYDTDSGEVYYHGDRDSEDIYADFETYPHSVKAFLVTDSRFESNSDYRDYMNKYFSDSFIKTSAMDTEDRFIEYDGKIFDRDPGKGILFESWDTESAEIVDFVPDESFAVRSVGYRDAGLAGYIRFVNTPDGWKVDNISY